MKRIKLLFIASSLSLTSLAVNANAINPIRYSESYVENIAEKKPKKQKDKTFSQLKKEERINKRMLGITIERQRIQKLKNRIARQEAYLAKKEAKLMSKLQKVKK